MKRGEKVLIIGIGGLGLLAVQIAKHFGAEIYALDIKPTSRALAKKFGAIEAFSHEQLDAQLAEGFTVDVVIDFVASNSSKCSRLKSVLEIMGCAGFGSAFASVQNNVLEDDFSHGGRIVEVGLSDETFAINSAQFLTTNVSGKLYPRYSLYLELTVASRIQFSSHSTAALRI